MEAWVEQEVPYKCQKVNHIFFPYSVMRYSILLCCIYQSFTNCRCGHGGRGQCGRGTWKSTRLGWRTRACTSVKSTRVPNSPTPSLYTCMVSLSSFPSPSLKYEHGSTTTTTTTTTSNLFPDPETHLSSTTSFRSIPHFLYNSFVLAIPPFCHFLPRPTE